MSTTTVRIDTTLYKKALITAKYEYRSIPKQIELWAEVGSKVMEYIKLEDCLAISQGLMRIVCEPVESTPIDKDALFAEVLSKSKQQEVSQDIKNKGNFIFEMSQSCPGKLEKVFRDGTRIIGQFVNGEFIPE